MRCLFTCCDLLLEKKAVNSNHHLNWLIKITELIFVLRAKVVIGFGFLLRLFQGKKGNGED